MDQIPLFVVAAYAVGVTVVGAWFARRTTTGRQWTVAGGGLGAGMLAVGLAGTRIGGAGTYGVAGNVITGGVWNLWWYGAATFAALATVGLFFAHPYRRLRLQTVGEIFWLRFGSRRGQVVTSLSVQTLYLAVNVIEPYVIGAILRSLTGISMAWGVTIGAVVLVSYTALGGLWGAAATNLIHSIVIIAGFLIVAVLGVRHLGGWNAMSQAIDDRLLAAGTDAASWWSPTGAGWMPIAGMIFAAAIHTPAASIYANFSTAARSSRLLIPGFLLGGLLAGCMPLLAGLIGMQALARFGSDGGLSGYSNITALAVEINPWLGGLALAAVLAAVISSGGPVLLSSATMFVRDWLPASRHWQPDRKLRAYRITTVVYGTLSAALAWIAAREGLSLLNLLLVGYAMVVPPGIAIAFLLYWPRTTEAGAFWGTASGYVAGVAWYLLFYQSTGIDPSHLTTVVPLLVIPLLSLLTRDEPVLLERFHVLLAGGEHPDAPSRG
ncbi:MAG TPA: hypothetical protein VLD67_10275 [Vicinamibacterales bacterium]|nr:hypothetical protein [Vicinamibacterales bacterium]